MADDWDMSEAPAPGQAGENESGSGGFGDNDMRDAPAAANLAGGDRREDADYVATSVAAPPLRRSAPTKDTVTNWAESHTAALPPPSPPAIVGYGGKSGAQEFMQNFDPSSHCAQPPTAIPSAYAKAGPITREYDAGSARGYGSENDGAYTSRGEYNTFSRPVNSGSAKLFIGNLGPKVDEAALRREFEMFGAINTVTVITDLQNGRSRGFGYVEFINATNAAQAMALKDGAEIDGRNIWIDFTTSGKPARGESVASDGGGGAFVGGRPKTAESATLFVGGLPHEATEEMLRDIFSAHGTVTDVKIPVDRDSGTMKGFAYVVFHSIHEARRTIEKMNGAYIAGRNIRLDYAAARIGGRGDGGCGIGRPNPPCAKLFIGNFSDDADEDRLREIFQVCGTITDVHVPKDGITGLNKGHAYVSFSTIQEAIVAHSTLNGSDLAGKNIRIDYAEARLRSVKAPVTVDKRPSPKLFVGNVSEDATEEDLRQLFEPCGELVDVNIPRNGDTGVGRGFGFVSYSNDNEAIAAMNLLDGAILAGKVIRLNYAEVKERGGSGGDEGGGSKQPSLKLFLGNITRECSEDHLRETFGPYGEITDCFLLQDANGENKGIAFLSFSSVEEATAAKCALDGTEVAGRNIRVDFAEMKERASKGVSPKDPYSKLFIGNISEDCTEGHLREAFSTHGEIIDCYIPQYKGMNNRIAFLSFSSVEEAIAAKDALDGAEIAGKTIRLDFADVRERQRRIEVRCEGSNEPSLKLFIGNISRECTEAHLQGPFGAHGKIIELYIPQENNVNKGIAFCSFSSIDEAIAAKEALNGTKIAGENIRIDFSHARARQSRESNSEPSSKLFIGNISTDCTEEDLRNVFNAYGEIADAYIPKDDNGINKGIAFLSFSSAEEAIAARDALHDTTVAGKNIRIGFAQVKERAPRGRGGPNKPSEKLFIGGISAKCTNGHLCEVFGAHGEVTIVHILKDQDGENKGIGFVSFSSVDEAVAAKDALDETEVAGETIHIDFAQVRERRPQESNNEPSQKLVLFGLSAKCTDEDLREVFSAHGEITTAVIPKNGDGGNKGIGFVSFSSIDEAVVAKDALSGTKIAGETARIDFAQVRERPSRGSNSEPSLKLFIRGISAECTDDELRQAFQAHGEVVDASIPTAEDGANKGIAIVSFSCIDEAIAAKDALSGTEIAGETIRIDFAQVKKRAPREANNPPAPKLFVGGVSEHCNEEMLQEFFAECGKLTNVCIPKNEFEVNKGYAYVTFFSVEGATSAFKTLNGKECAGNAIRLSYAGARQRLSRGAKLIEHPTKKPSNTLFVGGISLDTSAEVIKAAFSLHGAVLRVIIAIDPEEKTPRGFCYVTFATIEEAMAAVQSMKGAEIEGRQLRIDFAGESDGDPTKPLVTNFDHAFDPNEGLHSRLRERNAYVAADVNVPDRFELFLLQEGEKKISEAIDTRTPNSSIFTILKEDHTLCNLLRAHLLQNPAVLFAGYKIPHPLFAKVELRVQTDGSITPKEAVVQCSKKLVSDLGQFSREFTKEFELRKMVANAGSGPQIGL